MADGPAAAPVPSPSPRRLGVRVRIAAAATAVVAAALVLGGLAFWLVLRTALYDSLGTAADQDAQAIAAQIGDVDPDDFHDDDRELQDALPDFEDRVFQILDSSTGQVVAASRTAPRSEPITSATASAGTIVSVRDGTYAVATRSADSDWTVIAGRSTDQAEQTLSTVAVLLLVAVPGLIVVVALTSWFVAGRALAPVDRMRRQVDAVTADDLSRRVSDPATRDEIGRLAQTLNGMLARLQTASLTQRRFISDASHELKSPLASMRQYAEVARAHPDRITIDELSDVVLGEGARLEQLVAGMLILARADEHGIVPTDSDVDLDDLLFAEAHRLRGTAGLRVGAAGVQPVRVHGDGGLLAQAVRNLVDNAARHATSAVAVSVAEVGDRAVLCVDDDGAGVAPADRQRIFERFVRLDDARSRDAGGSGLGLAIVAEIVAAHGGRVQVLDSDLGGARFEVSLPAVRS